MWEEEATLQSKMRNDVEWIIRYRDLPIEILYMLMRVQDFAPVSLNELENRLSILCTVLSKTPRDIVDDESLKESLKQ